MATDPVYGRTVKVRGDPEQHFRLLNNVLAAEGVLRALKAKEFAQAPGITRRLRKKEERRRIMRYEANKKILQVLDPEGRCVPPPRARPVGAPMSPPPSLTARFPLIGARSVPPNGSLPTPCGSAPRGLVQLPHWCFFFFWKVTAANRREQQTRADGRQPTELWRRVLGAAGTKPMLSELRSAQCSHDVSPECPPCECRGTLALM